MEALTRFIEICFRKQTVVLDDCINPNYNEDAFNDILYATSLLVISFIATVYQNMNYIPDMEMEENDIILHDYECGDFNLMDEEPPPELYWEYENEEIQEDHSPY
ncbi:hypothetical protein CDAR_415171 [Caerostris darwini]|uniref:Uncharacterized protein n=1 Tax=Caerostris darwini TaxID=1538125 RepID=A0AAV4TNX2_9ARAC|nr:hypothetical protein CDAR_415171 [Caerostris darwini]